MFCTEKTIFYVTDALNNIQDAVGKRETGESAVHVAEHSQTTILLYMFCTEKQRWAPDIFFMVRYRWFDNFFPVIQLRQIEFLGNLKDH